MTALGMEAGGARVAGHARVIVRPWIWFAIGSAASLLASGWGWSIPLAAWIAPVFLLRFSRTSRPAVAIMALAILSVVQLACFSAELATNMLSGVLMLLTPILGVILVMPYILDRLFAGRLGPIGRLLLFPAASAALEFAIAAALPVGASMGVRAFTQGENLELVQVISLTGPYAIGFLIASCATVVNHIWENPGREVALRWGGTFFAAVALVVGYGEVRLAMAAWGAGGATVKVAGITPELGARTEAWSPVTMANFPPTVATRASLETPQMRARFATVQSQLLADTRAAARAGAKVVVWSETGAPSLEADKAALLQRVAAVAREEGVYVDAAIGVPFERNETYLIAPDGRVLWHYRKNHPVPGLEPVAPLTNPVPVAETPLGRLSNLICFDADFPALARARADVMLVPGWDWLEAGYTHTMKMARLRAIENGYSLVRVAFKSGASAAFDPYGRTLAMLNTLPGQSYTMIVDVPSRRVPTLYSQTGDIFAWLCVAGALGLCGYGLVRPTKGR